MRKVEFVPFRLSDKADIFSIRINNNKKTVLNEFLITFHRSDIAQLKKDFDEILKVLDKISKIGVKESFFRPEGQIYDRLCAIPVYTLARDIRKTGTLRLYCVRISEKLLIVGGGGCKTTQTYQEDSHLAKVVKTLQKIDWELSILERDGLDLHTELFNLTIYI